MAEFDLESIIKSGVEKALNTPVYGGKAITEWAAIGMKNAGSWINVKDRLPEKSQYVLVSLVNEIDGHRMKTPRIGYHTGDEGHGWFIVLWNEWAIDSDFMVTHWMPLPEPPEEAKP